MRARSSVRPAKGTASDNAAAPGCRSRPPWGRLSRPAPGSCGNRQRRHPTHIEDEADEAPFPLRLREPAHRDGAEAEYLLDPPVDRLHDRLAPLEPPSAFVGLQLPTHPLRAGTSAPLGCHARAAPPPCRARRRRRPPAAPALRSSPPPYTRSPPAARRSARQCSPRPAPPAAPAARCPPHSPSRRPPR